MVLLYLVYLQIILITWACSGTRPEFMFPMFVVSIFMYAWVVCYSQKKSSIFVKALNFSVCALLIISICQYFNPYMERVLFENYAQFKTLDYIPYLPTSIKSNIWEGNALYSAMELVMQRNLL